MDVIERLLKLQEIDRVRDRLQKRLDEVPVKLRVHAEAVAAAERALEEQRNVWKLAKAEAARNELSIAAKESEREKVKGMMNAPKITGREYTVLQEQLAGVLADIGSLTDQAVAGLERAAEAEKRSAELEAELEKARAAYQKAKADLEGGLKGVRDELGTRNDERKTFLRDLPAEPLDVYERVRRKHPLALAALDGTIDRAAGRIGNDVHCSSCHMQLTSNDVVKVVGRKTIVQCRSCMRILYVP